MLEYGQDFQQLSVGSKLAAEKKTPTSIHIALNFVALHSQHTIYLVAITNGVSAQLRQTAAVDLG